MHPYIHIGGRMIPAYSVFGTIGILIGWFYVWVRSKKEDASRETDYVLMYMYGIFGALAGAKIFSLLQNIPEIIHSFSLNFEEFILFWTQTFQSGMVFYGGLIGAVAAVFLYCRICHICFTDFLSILVPAVPLAHGFGRIGCYFAGCCYGYIGIFPVQLTEAAFNFLLSVLLTVLSEKCVSNKKILGTYFINYAVMRFILEFFRADAARGFLGPLSTSQVISIFIFAIGFLLFMPIRIPISKKKSG